MKSEVGLYPTFLYCAQFHGQHCTSQAFEQLEVLYIHNVDQKQPTRPGLEPGTTVGSNEPSGSDRK